MSKSSSKSLDRFFIRFEKGWSGYKYGTKLIEFITQKQVVRDSYDHLDEETLLFDFRLRVTEIEKRATLNEIKVFVHYHPDPRGEVIVSEVC